MKLALLLLRLSQRYAAWRARPRRARLRRGRYQGRLAFDSDSGFHLDEKGRHVVSEDEGKTWRYARRSDPSHLARYHRDYVGVNATANVAALGLPVEAHHHQVQPNDLHYDPEKPNLTRMQHDRDAEAPTVTGHTEAYRER